MSFDTSTVFIVSAVLALVISFFVWKRSPKGKSYNATTVPSVSRSDEG